MTTAAPVADSFEGRYTVTEGRCTLAITCSPWGVVRTVSSAVFPSDPGAPLGQRNTTGASAAKEHRDVRRKASRTEPTETSPQWYHLTALASPKTDLLKT